MRASGAGEQGLLRETMSNEFSIQLDVILVERNSKGRDVERDMEDPEEDESELSLVERTRTRREGQLVPLIATLSSPRRPLTGKQAQKASQSVNLKSNNV